MTRVLWLAVFACVVQCRAMSQDELEDFSNFLLKTSSLDLHVKSADPDGLSDEDDVVSDHAWEDSGKFEGDLILNDRQRRVIVETVEGLARNGLTDSTKRWPNNEVVYFIQKEHFNGGQVQAIQDGIDDLGRASCVKFRPYRKGDRDAVVIQGSRRGCFSQVGYQGGYQVLNLSGRHPVGRGCFRHGTVVHELLHTLGFYHMQSSPDRDDYINVIWSNIVQPARHNFRKYNSFSVSDFGVGYDYDSVLHYSRRAFSANGQDTLVPKKSGAEIGQRVGLSDKDTQKLNKMYCDADNDAVQADENTTQKPKNKKKKPKNQPFEGQGIGYHQGKTVVIKLPAAQPLSNVPSTHVFDFSKTPQIVSPPEADYQFGKEVTYSYKPVISLHTETVKEYQKSYEITPTPDTKIYHKITDGEAEFPKKGTDHQTSVQHTNDINSVKPDIPIDEYDKDLQDAFHRLTKIVKQHVYPNNQDYIHKIDKDYSKFYTPLQQKKPSYILDSLNKKIMQPISYSPITLTVQNQDSKQGGYVQYHSANDKFKNSEMEDRMDISFRTSLPTKKPYSLYDQTETPYYATLEYLKNREDYSKIYSPKTAERYAEDNPATNNDNDMFKQSIKINPHDQGFYADYGKENDKASLTDASKNKNDSKEVKANTYELDEISAKNKLGSKNKLLEDKSDFSYGISLPYKKPYSVYEQTETPTYANLEYLKGRHDFSSLYKPRALLDHKKMEESVAKHEDIVILPPVRDWYSKDSNKRNDGNSYSDYRQLRSKEQKEKTKDPLKDELKHNNDNDDDDDDDNNNSSKYITGNYDQDFQTGYEKENNERLTEDSNNNDESYEETPIDKTKNGEHYDKDYYTDYEKDDSGYSTDDDENDKKPLKNNQKYKNAKYDHDYSSTEEYEKEHGGRIEASTESDDGENRKKVPKNGEKYTLHGAPVPLTMDWFKPSYLVPVLSSEDDNSKPHEDHR